MEKILLNFIVICLIKIVHNQLIIRPADSTVSYDQYKPFIALCTGQGNTRIVSWRSPSQMDIEENSNARVIAERKGSGLRLRIRNLTRLDQGKWTCSGIDQDGKSLTNTLQINVKVPIMFFSEPIQYAESNSAVLIKCRVLANPSAEISWYKGINKDNIISSNYEQKEDGLRINRVSLIDNDIFWCQADVIETGESKDYQIQVILAHGITSTRVVCVSPCAVIKRTANLICEANGIPPPQFTWFYGENAPLIVNGISKYVVRDNRLVINHVDETDIGRYSCHAFNDYDKKGQRAEYMLNVIVPPHLAPIPPIEINFDENFSSQRITFSCRLERGSTENLSLEWIYANNTPVQPINGISIDNTQVSTHRLIELKFNPVRREHHGNYTCVAKNSADTESSIAQLTIKYKPILINSYSNEVYSVPNYHAIMKCKFDSFPPPIIQWIKLIPGYDSREQILDDTDLQVIDITTKQIDQTIYETQLTYNPSEEDFGYKFQCRANNSHIEKNFLTLRRAETPPQAVRIIEVRPKSYSMEIIVQRPSTTGGLPLLHYIVKYEQIGIPDSSRIVTFPVLSNDSQILEIKSLQPAATYRSQIAVETHAGQSSFSIPVPVTTLNGDAPLFYLLNGSCIQKNSYLIKWFIEDNGGTPISRVEIFYSKIRNGKIDKPDKITSIETQTTEYELKNLKKNTNYTITVRLYNKANYTEQTTNVTCQSRTGPQKPSLWIIIGIITGIILITVIGLVLFILSRVVCTSICGKPQHNYSAPGGNNDD